MLRSKKGINLIEIVVVLVIVGLLATLSIPVLNASFEQSRVQSAKNNLMAMAAAQQKFAEDFSAGYCLNAGVNPSGLTVTCGDSKADLNTNLHIGISDNFAYACASPLVGDPAGTVYRCTAQDAFVTLTLLSSAQGITSISCAGLAKYCPS